VSGPGNRASKRFSIRQKVAVDTSTSSSTHRVGDSIAQYRSAAIAIRSECNPNPKYDAMFLVAHADSLALKVNIVVVTLREKANMIAGWTSKESRIAYQAFASAD
jgi:hypothetical protein